MRCSSCKEESKVVARTRIGITMDDSTGSINTIIFDLDAEKLIPFTVLQFWEAHNEETQTSIRNMADQVHLLTSKITQLASYICEELPSQININLEKDESAIIRSNGIELQEFQGNESKDAVEKKVDVQKMSPQYQLVQVNESNEQPPNAVSL
ncbi:uncharacterized protein [Coffea arabica]|uniref:Uncharacterized protein isoform X2 n=1 Tax=Coffea arabica TaxID=13443 RepID=A0ABM4WII7_COFAR